MGVIPSKSTASDAVSSTGQALLSPGGPLPLPGLRRFVQRYIAQCNAHRGVVLVRYAGDGFAQLLAAEAPRICEEYTRHGKKYFVRNSVYFEVLESDADVKGFAQHVKGLELLSFLSLPSVTVPRAGLIRDRGVTVACASLHHILNPVPFEACPSTHVATVRVIISKVLRLKGDPALTFYEGGDGSLIAVDASALLPVLSLRPGGAKTCHLARPELFIGRDCLWTPTPAPANALQPAGAAVVAESTSLPFLNAVISSVASVSAAKAVAAHNKPRALQYLHAIVALGGGGSTPQHFSSHDESLKTVSAPTRLAPPVLASHQLANVADGEPMTRFVLGPLLRACAERVETATADDLDVASLMHYVGLGLHLLGALWSAVGNSQVAQSGKQRVAVEIMARAGKVWLNRQRGAGLSTDATALELFRCVHDDAFITRELLPIAVDKFGRIDPPINATHLPFRWMSLRLMELTGVSVSKGAITGTTPRIRVARHAFDFTSNDELLVASVAVKRDDPMSVAAVLSAAGTHARSASRTAGVVQQLRSRRLDNPVLLLFVGMLELQMVDILISGKNIQGAIEVMERAVDALFAAHNTANAHDRLFATRHGLRLVSLLTRVDRIAASHTCMKRLLEVGALRELSHVGLVGARQMLEEYHRCAVDGFSHSREEALLVAQSWVKLCPNLFGPLSLQNCKATKLLLVCLVKCRKHTDAIAVANDYMSLAIRAFGPIDVHTAMAMNDVATLTWRRDPQRGLVLYQKALDVFRRVPAGAQQVPSTLYNMALASMRINRLRQALGHLALSREAAIAVNDRPAMEMCDRMQRAVFDIAATKIQRWVRDCMYGIAPSQTSRTDLCSTLSWSDKDDVASTTGDIMHTAAVISQPPGHMTPSEDDDDDFR